MASTSVLWTAAVVTLFGCVLGCGGSATDRVERGGDGDGDETAGSTALSTSAMIASFEAIAPGDGTVLLRAELRVGGPDGAHVKLDTEDELVASSGGDSVRMAENSMAAPTLYASRFEETDEPYQIALERGDGGSAPDSSVSLPAQFNIVGNGIEAGDSLSRAEEFEVRWRSTGAGTVFYSILGDCIETVEGMMAESELVVPAGTVVALPGRELEVCPGEVNVEITIEGQVDPALGEGSRFVGIRRQRFEFVSVP